MPDLRCWIYRSDEDDSWTIVEYHDDSIARTLAGRGHEVHEVVPAERLAEVERELQLQAKFRANSDATIRDASAELTRTRAALERAREALEEAATELAWHSGRWSAPQTVEVRARRAAASARSALDALPRPTTPTAEEEKRDGADAIQR